MTNALHGRIYALEAEVRDLTALRSLAEAEVQRLKTDNELLRRDGFGKLAEQVKANRRERDEALAQVAVMSEALRELVDLKALKDIEEPDPDSPDSVLEAYYDGRKSYRVRKPLAWDAARQALATMGEAAKVLVEERRLIAIQNDAMSSALNTCELLRTEEQQQALKVQAERDGEIKRLRRWLSLIAHVQRPEPVAKQMALEALSGETPVMGG